MSSRYHQAASDSYLELLKEATRRDLNLSDEDGMTPTLLAAYHGNLEALEIICSRGGDPDRCDIWGNTPLHYAASNGHAPCVSFLINFGANIFALDNDFQSPLDAAAGRERGECVALLDAAATAQGIMNPRKVARLKEQAQKNARRQVRECERRQQKHQSKMARAHTREEAGTLSSSRGTLSGEALSSASGASMLGSLSKGIKGTFKMQFKKNKGTAPGGPGSRDGQRNVMEVFGEEEEGTVSGEAGEKLLEEDSCAQHESILSRPGLGNLVFKRNRLASPEDMSDDRRELGFNVASELFRRQGAAQAEDAAAVEEGEEGDGDSWEGALPWEEAAVEWEEEAVDATPLEVFLQSHHLEQLLPFFVREQLDLEALLLCSDEDLQSIQMQLGPRKRVLSAINTRKQALQQPGPLVDTSL
ncbi:ankyrin repeat and SAM domain-containing protein 4B [Pipistrellus kuhlii]|uniref:Ankyrin repeat and sterile alpha motif domain containing 4B n=1 Tax=Pipistrellus kuhlii TaxID=59472 RepID=A0A7J7T2B7_PIPKU|nr:ankyrin repeat and SAM domain-containing protein 4B [Pipistrellus kuhlii]KAF6294730.1 ankyrin repeat and sterile alpha motif domain containing 4B [Pipistrellus kuhlii]